MTFIKGDLLRLTEELRINEYVYVEKGALLEYVGDTQTGLRRVRIFSSPMILKLADSCLEPK